MYPVGMECCNQRLLSHDRFKQYSCSFSPSLPPTCLTWHVTLCQLLGHVYAISIKLGTWDHTWEATRNPIDTVDTMYLHISSENHPKRTQAVCEKGQAQPDVPKSCHLYLISSAGMKTGSILIRHPHQ